MSCLDYAATIFALLPMALGITGQGGFISTPLAVVVNTTRPELTAEPVPAS